MFKVEEEEAKVASAGQASVPVLKYAVSGTHVIETFWKNWADLKRVDKL